MHNHNCSENKYSVMRFKVSINKSSHSPLYYDYQYDLASLLYKWLAIANETFANEMHNHRDLNFLMLKCIGIYRNSM